MKRGYTKPFSRGRLGEEQRRDKARAETIKYHVKREEYDRIDELLLLWKNK